MFILVYLCLLLYSKGSGNSIGDEGIKAMVETLKTNSTLNSFAFWGKIHTAVNYLVVFE